MTLRVITANRLKDGDVVYLAEDGSWTSHLADARVADADDFADELLAAAKRDVEARLVLDPYPMNVAIDADGGIRPLSAREAIRSRGPSVRTDLGKQAEEV